MVDDRSYSNIARPYALSAFEYAKDKDELTIWKSFLGSAADIAKDPSVTPLFANPEISSAKLLELFQDILASEMNAARKNFLLLLAENNRLMILPAIYDLYGSYYAQLKKTSLVRVITAIEIKEDFKQQLKLALAKRIRGEIILNCEIDPSIIAGAIIHVGDRVIDGSIRGKLARLLEFSLR
jgi:F-type H+-transporting ATPase subunit delta